MVLIGGDGKDQSAPVAADERQIIAIAVNCHLRIVLGTLRLTGARQPQAGRVRQMLLQAAPFFAGAVVQADARIARGLDVRRQLDRRRAGAEDQGRKGIIHGGEAPKSTDRTAGW